uniref:VPS37B subunit of ESCRT-I n=1 Tax=Oncorhynchus kisutch TaxID=8019 RepID=A0A8C7CN92_ONCKI
MSGFGNKFSSYSMTQLNELLEDDDKLNSIVQEMEEMQEVQQTKEMILASNRSLAEQNLQLQPRLNHQKSQLTKCYSSLQESFEAYQVHKSKLGFHGISRLLSWNVFKPSLFSKQNMADSFLDGDVTLDAFMDSYQSNRKLAHLRRVKIDKLQEMVLKGGRLPRVPVSCSHPQEVSARPAPLYTEANNHNPFPVPQPRRAPPPPPAQQPPAVAPQPAVFSYPATPYPPIPPRAGHPLLSVKPGYQHPFVSQYPPALPQRPPPRMAPQSGFMIQ